MSQNAHAHKYTNKLTRQKKQKEAANTLSGPEGVSSDDESDPGWSGGGGSGAHGSSVDEEPAGGAEESGDSAQVAHVHQLLQGRLREEYDSPRSRPHSRYIHTYV